MDKSIYIFNGAKQLLHVSANEKTCVDALWSICGIKIKHREVLMIAESNGVISVTQITKSLEEFQLSHKNIYKTGGTETYKEGLYLKE